MAMKILRRTGLLLSAVSLSACFSFVTKEEGQKMTERIDLLERQLKSSGEQIKQQTEELNRLMKESQRLNTGLADSLQQSEKLRAELMQTKGQTEDIQKTLEAQQALQKQFLSEKAALDTRITTIEQRLPKPPPEVPDSPDAVLAAAQRALDAKQLNDARRMFSAFASKYGSDPRAAKAQLSVGDIYFREGKYDYAIGAYVKVIDNFPKADEVEISMYKAGESFLALKRCKDAQVYFQELIKRYPKTRFKADANDQITHIKDMMKSPKGSCVQ